MRIISGSLKGRVFESPHGQRTHPMSEKMRGALFNVLGDIVDLTVFDCYGGSGALSFEAISRGAKRVQITEIERSAIKTIDNNINQLGLIDKVKLIQVNCASWSEHNYTTKFNLVLCDPPYDDIKINQLKTLQHNVKAGGLMILSLPSEYEMPEFESLKLELQKKYGDCSLRFYRNIKIYTK